MPSGYWEPRVLSSSTETRVVIGYLAKNWESTAKACFTKLISSAAKMFEYTRSGLAAWMALMVESQRGLVGKGTYQVLGSFTIWTLELAFFNAATKALVSEIPNRYFGETMKILLTLRVAASLPAAVPSMYVLGTIDTQ